MKKLLATSLLASILIPPVHAAGEGSSLDFGPLAPLIGTWKSVEAGIDVAPGQEGSSVGKGGPAVEQFTEVITFEPAADATNASDQYLTALYYKQEVFKKSDGSKFHDQRGYLIYDKKNQIVYNSFCVPRATCVVAEGKAGEKMTLVANSDAVAESKFMKENASTTGFSFTIEISDEILSYSQVTNLEIYGKPFAHSDSSKLKKVK